MRKSKQIVVITSHDDAHLPFVQKHLPTELITLDQALVVDGKSISLRLDSKSNTMVLEYGSHALNAVSSVWLRKPLELEYMSLPLSEHYSRYAKFAIENISRLVYSRFSDALWISDYYAISRASDKGLQLELARKLGFRVPDTIFTSSSKAARQFMTEHPATITKPIECEGLVQNDKLYFFYANKVTASTNLDGLHLAPAIFQEEIEDAVDIRVTVVGDKVFAASITGGSMDQPDSNVRDWRVTNYDDSAVYEAVELPKKVRDLCVQHTKELGLNFGAIDLVRNNKGDYWFLENNPNGQWAFVEDQTGQPIGKAIADLLMSN